MLKKQIDTPQGTVVYWVSDEWDASRVTLVFLHGLTADHTMFKYQVRFFKRDYNVVVWDAPCHGYSRPFDGFTMDAASNSWMAIAHEESIESCVMVGQSFGGYIAQALIARHPEMVAGFVGIGSMPYGTSYYSDKDLKKLLKGASMCKMVPWSLLKTASATAACSTEEGRDNMTAMVSKFDKKEYMQVMGDFYQAFIDDNQDLTITCPVLILRGEDDTMGMVQECCDAWHTQTGFPLSIISGAGHNANVDNPDETNAYIHSFLSEYFS